MHPRLTNICEEFETLKGFLDNQTPEKTEKLHSIFYELIDCFSELKGEKLEYPKEFREDVRLYKEEYAPIIKKFEDTKIRYLMLSDFYDFVRITKKFKSKSKT